MTRETFMDFLSQKAMELADDYYAGKISKDLPNVVLDYYERMIANPDLGTNSHELRILVRSMFEDLMHYAGEAHANRL